MKFIIREVRKMKRKIGILISVILLLSMAFSVASAQKMIKEHEKGENQVINVLNNSPPTNPVITCPDKVKENRVFILRGVSTDPDNDQIYYRLKIGESEKPSQWLGPYESGVEYASGVGIFQYTGDITIGFQAKDELDAESDWSYRTVTFTKTKSKPIILPLINILQNHPQMFPKLRQLLGLL